MRILFTCGREAGYPRNAALLQALVRNHCEVVEVTDNVPGRSILFRSLKLFTKLLTSGAIKNSDVIIVGFFGQLLVPFLRRLTSKPILFDILISVYDTLCFDRKKFTPRSPIGLLSFALDRIGSLSSNRLILDSQAHAHYFSETFRLPLKKIEVLYLGCPDQVPARPRSNLHQKTATVFTVSGFLPLHGMDIVINAAKRLPHIRFILGGKGPLFPKCVEEVNRSRLTNVEFTGPIPYQNLAQYIARADICLGGHFSNIPKAHRVISNKTFQFLTNGKPVIVGDTPANREVLTHGRDSFLCPTGNAPALAQAIETLIGDDMLRKTLGANGRQLYHERLSVGAATKLLSHWIEKSLTE